MSDLISRADAISVLDNFTQTDTLGHTPRQIVEALPSAQPERQVELDGTESNIEILSELRAQFNCFDEVEEPCYRALSDAICALSAQPEVIRCKDCKHYYYADNRIPQEQRYVCDLDGDRWKPDSFCSFAERRTDG